MEKLEIDHLLLSIKSIGVFAQVLKIKHSLPSPFCSTLKSLIYMVFMDPHQGIDN
jgi:hypothetical protein